MKDIRNLLREADPAAGDPGLSAVEAAVMRRSVIGAIVPPPAPVAPWQRPLAVAAMVALTLAGGVIAGRNMASTEGVRISAGPAEEGERRQLQFDTPGGTRIIWVFDSEFDLKETTQ